MLKVIKLLCRKTEKWKYEMICKLKAHSIFFWLKVKATFWDVDEYDC